jgi:hypothetical protein
MIDISSTPLVADIKNYAFVPDVDLDLRPAVQRNDHSRIRVRCSALIGHATIIAEPSRAMKGLESGTLDLMGQIVDDASTVVSQQKDTYQYLTVVVGKLDVFKNVVDEAVKVRPNHN